MTIKGTPFTSFHNPRQSESLLFGSCPSRESVAVFPSATNTLGCTILICPSRYGIQKAISSRVGGRFPKDWLCLGLQFITLPMYTESRDIPIASIILSNNSPAGPTKGIPACSSSAPGASPQKKISAFKVPTPKTIFPFGFSS